MHVQAHVKKQDKFNWFPLVIAEYSICTLGHFAVMAILSLYFIHSLALPATQAGWLLLFTSLSFRLSRIFISPLVSRLPVRQAAFFALFLTSLGYFGMAFVKVPLLIMPILLIVGLGHGTNTLLVKVMTANAGNIQKSGDDATKNKSPFLRYASLTTGINISAAIGSFAGSTLLFRSSASGVFLLAAIVYALAGLIAVWIPSQEAGGMQRPDWGNGLKLSIGIPALRRAMLFGFIGWFMYTQSYASLPLFIGEAVHRPDLLGSVFVVNAVLVVVAQLPISHLITRLRVPTSQIVVLAFLTFGMGFALLWLFPLWQVVYAAVVFWTLAEILIMPALDTLVVEGALTEYKQTAFTVNSIAVGLGEGIGNFAGVSIAGFFLATGGLQNLYMGLTASTLVAVTIALFVGNRRESMLHRWLRGQSLIPTWQTETLQPLQPVPSSKTEKLLAWLSASTYHEERSLLEAYPEILVIESGQLDHLQELYPTLAGQKTETLSQGMRMLRHIKEKMAQVVRESYVDMYGGLVLDLPPWLEEIQKQIAKMGQDFPLEQTAQERMTILGNAIKLAKAQTHQAPEIIAELHMLQVIACLETPLAVQASTIETAIQACQEALTVYKFDRYSYQHARVLVFLGLSYQKRQQGERRANLEQALTYYKAALSARKNASLTTRWVTTDLTHKSMSAHMFRGDIETTLEEAIKNCGKALQASLSEVSVNTWLTDQKTSPLAHMVMARDDPEATLHLSRQAMREAAHAGWIAAQATVRLHH